MEIGSQFEDDFFEEPVFRKIEKSKSYEAKVYKPFWYMESVIEDEVSHDALVTLKQKANFYYHSKKYAQAAEAYEKCLFLVPKSNNTWKREFLENLARSFLKLENAEKALEWSLKLDESSINEDQKVISMNLLALVCHRLGKYKEELEALHSCMHAHKSCPEFWLRLGLCYAGLFKINLPDYLIQEAIEDDESEPGPCCAFNEKQTLLMKKEQFLNLVCNSENATMENGACSNTPELNMITTKCDFCSLGIQIVSSCLIRTKTLIDSGGPNHLGVEKDEIIKDKIANSLKYMEVDESFIEIASKMLGTDFFNLADSLETQANFTEKQSTSTRE